MLVWKANPDGAWSGTCASINCQSEHWLSCYIKSTKAVINPS